LGQTIQKYEAGDFGEGLIPVNRLREEAANFRTAVEDVAAG